ncbi:MAG TPA: hypothetical protein VFT37_01290 [Telluria sp.]|nr:hypothetical protein [Telluria sp.]
MGIERDEVKLMVETAEMRIAASIARMEERDHAYKEDVARIRAEMSEFRAEVRADIKSLRRTIVVTGISAVLAIFFGVNAMNSALFSHFKDGVDAGASTAAEHEAIRREMRELFTDYQRRALEPPAAPKK